MYSEYDEIGLWSEVKPDIIEEYASGYTKIMRGQELLWGRRTIEMGSSLPYSRKCWSCPFGGRLRREFLLIP
jgi:hypothetical protein